MAINFPHNPNINDIHTEASLGRSWKWDGTSWLIYSSTTTGIGYSDLSVSTEAASGGGSLTYNNTNGQFTFKPAAGSGGGATNFTGLGDTPGTYIANKWIRVNTNGDGLEWVDAPSGGSTTFTGLNDTPNTFTANKLLKVNAGASALEWTDEVTVVGTITVANESTDTECYPLFSKDANGDIAPKTVNSFKLNSSSGQLEAGSFKKTGGTSSEFLKADGSVDTNTYSQSNHTHSYALNDLSNVDATTNLANGKILKYDLSSTSWIVADDNASGGGSGSFTGLSDTPSAHSNNKWLKSDGSALVWADAPVDTNTTYDLTASDGSVATEEKILLTGSDSSEDAVTLAVSGSLTIARSNNTITFGGGGGGATTLGGLTDVDTSGAADGKIIKHNGTSWEIASEIQSDWNESNANLTSYIKNKPTILTSESDTLNTVTGRGNTTSNAITVGDLTCSNLTVNGTTTTVNSNTVNIGDNILVLNSDETGTPSQNGGVEIERGTSTNVSIRWNETTDKWQYTNDGTNYSDIGSSTTDTNTTYSISADSNNSPNESITLTDSNGSTTGVDLKEGTNISLSRTGNVIEISSTDTTLNLIDEDDMASNSATRPPSQQSVKAYVDANSGTTESDTLATVTGRGATTSTACEFQNLTATGTLTAAFLNVKDPKIVLNSDFSGSGPTEDAYVRVERGSSSDVNIKWNESSDKWQATNDGSNYFDLGGGIPTGTIVMYNGDSAPSGWAICNGSNGTPDLRDKFIIGSGSSYNRASTGGYTDSIVVSHDHNANSGNQSSNHTHGDGNYNTNSTGDHYHQQSGSGSGNTGNQSTNHYHTIGSNKPNGSPGTWNVTASGGGHGHGYQTTNSHPQSNMAGIRREGGDGGGINNTDIQSSGGSHNHTINLTGVTTGGIDVNHTHSFNFNISGNTTYASTGDHAHNVTGNSGSNNANHTHNITVNSEGSSGSGRNLPPYYAITFIMKT